MTLKETMSVANQSPDAEAEILRREMAQVRHELHDDMGDVVESARELTDWRSYVRAHPFAALGVAAAVGFLVVPRKVAVMSPTADQLESLAKRDHLVVKPSATAGPAQPGWKSKVIAFGANMALRAALTYAGQKFGKVIGETSAEEGN